MDKFTFQWFNRLPLPERYSVLEDEGIYLHVFRKEGGYKVALFALSAFYVEVWLNLISDELYKAQAFTSYSRLDPFLSDIDITSIYAAL